ncbi:hypothetical protein [Bacillus sp. SD088]|uniref:hypothetical protein n=1 Tax=Bacillus sp. SD088 TaxID=2782012 RepID=UPI001F60CE8E|nr:hypothetical protein [Bacillus sp. SD088]
MKDWTKGNFGEKLYQFGLDSFPIKEDDHYTLLKVLNEFTLIASRNPLFKEHLISVQGEFANGFRNILLKGKEEGVIIAINIDHYAKILALVMDNISRSIMLGFEIEYKAVWKETVNSVLVEEAKI